MAKFKKTEPPDANEFAPGVRVIYHVELLDEPVSVERVKEYAKEHRLRDGTVGASDGVMFLSVKGKPGGPGPLQVYWGSKDGWSGEEYSPEQVATLLLMVMKRVVQQLPDDDERRIPLGLALGVVFHAPDREESKEVVDGTEAH